MPDTKNYIVKDLENDLDKIPKKNIIGYRRKVVKGKDGSRNLINLAIVKDPETGKTKTIATSHWKSRESKIMQETRSISLFLESTKGPGYMFSTMYSKHQPASTISQRPGISRFKNPNHSGFINSVKQLWSSRNFAKKENDITGVNAIRG